MAEGRTARLAPVPVPVPVPGMSVRHELLWNREDAKSAKIHQGLSFATSVRGQKGGRLCVVAFSKPFRSGVPRRNGTTVRYRRVDAIATPIKTIDDPIHVFRVIGSFMNPAPMKRATTGVP